MDIEHLSKSQIILLTLLVSFVTSIATGIVTVSLMDQAPPIVAQTVNRVIERTVETVSAEPSAHAAAAVVTQEKTVVIKESDLISQAVDRVSPSLVRLYAGGEADAAFLGIGVVLDASGTIVTDASALGDRAEATLTLSDATRVRAFVASKDKDTGLSFLRIATSTEMKMPQWKPVKIATERPVLGATAIALAGKTTPRIASGLVTELAQEDAGLVLDTNIPESSLLNGSPLIDTNGNLLGVSTGVSRASSPSGFLTAAVLIPPANAKKP